MLQGGCLHSQSAGCPQPSVRPCCRALRMAVCGDGPCASLALARRRIRGRQMDTPRIEAARDQGSRKAPAAPSTSSQGPAPGSNGPAIKARGSRPVQYPVQLKVNINQAMALSLQRVCKRWGVPEGIGARIAITQFLAQQDREYRGE